MRDLSLLRASLRLKGNKSARDIDAPFVELDALRPVIEAVERWADAEYTDHCACEGHQCLHGHAIETPSESRDMNAILEALERYRQG